MDIFEQAKNRINILDVCDLLGIKLNRNYKALCPFHRENTPSFSVHPDKNIFCCFGCGKNGDAISLVSQLLNMKPLESVKYLNDMLHLGIEINGKKPDMNKVNKYLQMKKAENMFKKWENETFQLLCDAYHVLVDWEKLNNPKEDNYIYALKNIGYIGYMIDEVFIYGTKEDKIWFKKNNGKVVEQCKMIIEMKKY